MTRRAHQRVTKSGWHACIRCGRLRPERDLRHDVVWTCRKDCR